MTRCISTCGMTTLNHSDLAIAPDRLSELPRLPRDEGGPVFAEPWQAQAFALAVKLSEQGHFTWKEWAAALTDELQAAAGRGEPDDGSRYYEHWLAALESLVTAKGLADPTALLTRKEAWAAAYRNTPHGQPVELLQSQRARSALASPWARVHVRDVLDASACELGPLGEQQYRDAGALPTEDPHPAFGICCERRSRRAARHAARARAGLPRCRINSHDRRAEQREGRVARRVVGTGAYVDIAHDRRPSSGAADRNASDRGAGVRALRRPAVGRLRRARDLSGRLPGAGGSDALASKTRSILTLSAGPMDGRTTTSGGRSTWTGGQRRADCARGHHAPVNGDALGYLTLFGVGSTVGMAALSGLLGWPIARLGARHVFARTVSLIVGGVSTALGLSGASLITRRSMRCRRSDSIASLRVRPCS